MSEQSMRSPGLYIYLAHTWRFNCHTDEGLLGSWDLEHAEKPGEPWAPVDQLTAAGPGLVRAAYLAGARDASKAVSRDTDRAAKAFAAMAEGKKPSKLWTPE